MSITIEIPPTLKEIAKKKIRHAILNGDLKPGERLVESKLAEKMGISRGPIREAITHLENEGLVKIVPYKGAYVVELTEKDFLEIFLIREMLEGLAARIAAETFNQKNFDYLQEILNKAKSIDNTELNKMPTFTTKFHEYLFEKCGIIRLYEIWKIIYIERRFFATLSFFYCDKNQIIIDHQKILESIKSGDPENAEKSMREHVQKYYKLFIKGYSKNK